ncbi:ABC transporter ATP-binding protein [Microbacterium sp. OR21]|uniref:ABC transporter ATP-binding protein n=1 Tax=Microbacterium sp. OR21 TaxID=3095346 RepID=UPI0039B4805C
MKLIWNTVSDLLPYLPREARRFLILYSVVTAVLALVDVGALGLLAAVLAAMVASGASLSLPVVGTIQGSDFPWLLAGLALLVVTKSAGNIALQWLATRRFASYELSIGDHLFDAYIQAPWVDRLKRTTAELVRLADVGIANAIGGFLVPVLNLPTLVVTSVALIVLIVIAQPMTALVTLIYLGLIALVLYLWVSRKAVQAGRVNRDSSMRVAKLMTEMVGALKEIALRGKFREVGDVVHLERIATTRARANLSFLSAVPKFVIDSALVGGFAVIGGVSLIVAHGDMSKAVEAIALFGVAGFRLVPAITGFQSIVTQTSSSAPHVRAVIADIEMSKTYIEHAERIGGQALPPRPKRLTLDNVAFTYPGADRPALSDVTLDVPMGSSVALVGVSGSGKSTLVDIMLGLLTPSQGDVSVDRQRLEDVLRAWRDRVGYVPQEVALFDGTIAQNVALTWSQEIDVMRVERALRQAQLWDFVNSRPGGLSGRIGERGIALSGGQRQRLGIARALYSDPLVLVMDEATSALDTQTEAAVTTAISGLHGEVTVITVAHRLATIRHADLVCLMADGRITARGNFEQLVRENPTFAEQARLAGLAG